MRQFLRLYELRKTLSEAITKAVLGNHPHQHCLSKKKLSQVETQLQACESSIHNALNFEELYAIVARSVRPPFKHANLLVYDLSLRIGAYKKFRPTYVYIHSGALVGAQYVLNTKRIPFRIQVSDLPAKFAALDPHEIEDCLCRYKDDLKTLRLLGALP